MNLEEFVRTSRAIERQAKRDRLKARQEGRTLEIGALAQGVGRKKGINLREYGQDVRYTAAELKRLDSRRRAVERQFTSTGTGIDAILAQIRPFPSFSNTSPKVSSDLAKARNIPKPQFVSARGPTLNFRVRSENPDPKRGQSHYLTSVKLLGLEAALRTPPDGDSYQPAVQKALSGGVQIHCQCSRYRYWYAYKATIAGVAIKPERGFPKIRNRRLVGLCCKHLIVTLNFVKRSGVFQKQLADRIQKLAGRVLPDQAERFTTQSELKAQKKARVDRSLSKVDRAKQDFKTRQRREKREKERLTRIATTQARQREQAKRREERLQSRRDYKAEFEKMQKDQAALQKKLQAEQKQRESAEKLLKKKEDDQNKEIARQVLIALRSAGLDDETIKANPVIKQSGYTLKELA